MTSDFLGRQVKNAQKTSVVKCECSLHEISKSTKRDHSSFVIHLWQINLNNYNQSSILNPFIGYFSLELPEIIILHFCLNLPTHLWTVREVCLTALSLCQGPFKHISIRLSNFYKKKYIKKLKLSKNVNLKFVFRNLIFVGIMSFQHCID